MAVTNYQYPKSDWSMPEFDIPQNGETIDINKCQSYNHQTKQFESLHEPVKCCTRIAPFIQGLVLGILVNGLTLTVLLPIWLAPRYQTGVIITNELPPGTILLYSGNISNLVGSTYRWLVCDGSEVSRLTYPYLFDVIGVTYGSGNGNDTFNLPDFRARFPLGSNGSNDTQLVAGGASSHVLTIPEMPAHSHDTGTLQVLAAGQHSHSVVDPGHNHGGSTGSGPFSGGPYAMISSGGSGNDGGTHSHAIPSGTTGITIDLVGNHVHSLQGLTGSVGTNVPIDMMPPYQTIHYIIRT